MRNRGIEIALAVAASMGIGNAADLVKREKLNIAPHLGRPFVGEINPTYRNRARRTVAQDKRDARRARNRRRARGRA